MSWSEFCLRRFAYNRQDLNDWKKVREVAWSSLIGSHYNPKKLPKNIKAFMPLEGSTGQVTDRMRERIREAQETFKKQKNGG
jgi:hypothetical protein